MRGFENNGQILTKICIYVQKNKSFIYKLSFIHVIIIKNYGLPFKY